MGEFALASVLLRDPDKFPLTVGTYLLLGPDENDFRLMAAPCEHYPDLVLFLLLQRFLVSGLTKGGEVMKDNVLANCGGSFAGHTRRSNFVSRCRSQLSPFYSNIGLTFDKNAGVASIELHFNRRTSLYGRRYIGWRRWT